MHPSIFVSALDTRIEIAFDPEVSAVDADRIAAVWSDAATDARDGGADTRIMVTLGTDVAAAAGPFDVTTARVDDALAMLSTKVTLAAIEHQKSQLIMLHACGVATEQGEVFAFVGPSGRGKTTLAATLGRKLAYVTDETIGVDPDEVVHPYRKPLSRVSGDGPKAQLSPSGLGLLPLPPVQLKIASVVLIDRQHNRSGAPLSEFVGLADALPLLVPELSYLSALDRPLQRLAALITSTGGVKRLLYGEADSIGTDTLEELASIHHVDAWESLPLHDAAAPGDGEFVQVRPLDGLAVQSAVVLLHHSTVRVLGGIGPAIWAATQVPATVEAISAGVERTHGSPPNGSARAFVASAVDELVEAGILRKG